MDSAAAIAGSTSFSIQRDSISSPCACSCSSSSCGSKKSGRLSSSRNGVSQGTMNLCVGGEEGAKRRHNRGFFEAQTQAKMKKDKAAEEYPWPLKMKLEEFAGSQLTFLSRFKPLANKPRLAPLPFELPLVGLEKKIKEVRELASNTGMDFSVQLSDLQEKYDQVRKDLYSQLSPVQRLSVARHPNRPTCLDHVFNITDKWIELHGDRGGFDDPALITGIGKIDGMSFMFIGHQKGRNTKENIYRNFAMPTPNGYRKALRMMRHAEHHGFPILTFIDTPGAYAGIRAEELGQGEAIAKNLREMFGLKVPIITTVIGEGGSGGALAIGCCDKMLMLENAVYYVASPEACAAILWKTAAAAPKATDALKITAQELVKLDVVDEVIPEPIGGAHSDPVTTSYNMKEAIIRHMRELLKLQPEPLMAQRVAKFRKIGFVQENVKVDPFIKRNMKKREAPFESDERKLLPSDVHQNLELTLENATLNVAKSSDLE